MSKNEFADSSLWALRSPITGLSQLTFSDFLSTHKIVKFIIIATVLCPIIIARKSFRYYELYAKYIIIKACRFWRLSDEQEKKIIKQKIYFNKFAQIENEFPGNCFWNFVPLKWITLQSIFYSKSTVAFEVWTVLRFPWLGSCARWRKALGAR